MVDKNPEEHNEVPTLAQLVYKLTQEVWHLRKDHIDHGTKIDGNVSNIHTLKEALENQKSELMTVIIAGFSIFLLWTGIMFVVILSMLGRF